MRKAFLVLSAVLIASVATAELQNIEVGGALRIRGAWLHGPDAVAVGPPALGNQAIVVVPVTDNNASFVEHRTRLNVKADFTDSVSAFIELDSYDTWGEDFRSEYLTGLDRRAQSYDDVEVYQSYIEAVDMWGQPLQVRIGRQEIILGSEWLVGNNDTGAAFTGLSFDALCLTYATDQVSVTALWSKLVERCAVEEDGDTDLYGVYASYLGIEDMVIDAYWLFVRDARAKGTTQQTLFGQPFGPPKNTYGTLDVHTFGLRGAGTMGAFDLEAEVAYQYLDSNVTGAEGDSDAWAGNLELGYTFDMELTPRIFLGGAYFEGARDGDAPFNRLFSDWEYSKNYDMMSQLTGFGTGCAGVSAMATESLMVAMTWAYLELDRAGNNDNDLGWEGTLSLLYDYSEDLSLEVGYSHFIQGDAAPTDDDQSYLYFETKVCF